jgi:hypothetical protein
VKSLAWHHCFSRSYCSTERRVGTVCHGPRLATAARRDSTAPRRLMAAGMEQSPPRSGLSILDPTERLAQMAALVARRPPWRRATRSAPCPVHPGAGTAPL